MNFEMKYKDKFIQKSIENGDIIFSRKFMEKYLTLDNLNDYLLILLEAYEEELINGVDLEWAGDNVWDFLFFGEKYGLNDVLEEEYKIKFPGINLNFVLGLIVIDHFMYSTAMALLSKEDIPTLRACLETSYEYRKEVEERSTFYFEERWSYPNSPMIFLKFFFNSIYDLLYDNDDSGLLIIYNYIDNECSFELKNSLKKLLDILMNSKIIKKGFPYGISYEVYQNNILLVFVIIEIGKKNELGERKNDQIILTDNLELKKLLGLCIDVRINDFLEKKMIF